jgi:hypothetical protein
VPDGGFRRLVEIRAFGLDGATRGAVHDDENGCSRFARSQAWPN